ncbi:MAG: hypothetical protein CVT95_07255, partial [Bacteroidetes bacterium HGW-Bacteroidetes-12]
ARGIQQVELGKPQMIFLTGEYGIGKSSLAGVMKYLAKEKLLGIHVLLGGAKTLDDVATKTVEAVIKDPIYETTIAEKTRNFLSKYIGNQGLFGVNINLENLKADGPVISHGYLPFLRELLNRVKDTGIKGVMLILDELNGITGNSDFAYFIKTLVDEAYHQYFDKENKIIQLNYPVLHYPVKVTSIGFEKQPEYEGKLVGIKGQYLIFENGIVLNIRKYTGYVVTLSF